MPIPSLYVPATAAAPPRAQRQMPTVQIVGGNGDSVWLTGATDGYDLLSERGMFAIPDPGAQFKDGAGDGARWTGSRRPARTFDLNVQVRGDTGDEFSQRMARLADILDDTYGPMTIRAVTGRGAREIQAIYTSGWDGSGSGFLWQNIPFTVTAPTPFWQATTPQTVTWSAGDGKPFLSSATAFFPVQLAKTTSVFGATSITNPGDVASPGVWTITGPGNTVVVHDATGAGFSLPANLAPTDVITVDGDALTVRDQTGANRWDLLDDAPKIWRIPPKTSSATVSVSSVATGTSVVLAWYPRYKLGA